MKEWRCIPLGELADLQAGAGFPPAMQGRLEGELPLAKVGDISRAVRAGGQGLLPPLHHITRVEAGQLRARIFPAGSTVFAKIGEAISQNYRLFTDREAAFDNNVMGAIPRPGVEARYLFRFLQTLDLYAYSSRTTVPALRKSVLEKIPVPLPDATEQRRIADILDKADAIRRQRKEAIALTEELLRSAFLEMFGDPVANPKGWDTSSVSDLCEDKQYGTAEKANSEMLGVPVLRMNNITYGGELDLTNLKWVNLSERDTTKLDLRPGDVLFNRVNSHELVGKTAVWSGGEGYTFAGYLIRLRPKATMATGTYLAAAMNMPSLKRRLLLMAKPSINMANISSSDLDRLVVPIPPVQKQLAYDVLKAKVHGLRGHYLAGILEAEALFQSAVDRAFRGALRA